MGKTKLLIVSIILGLLSVALVACGGGDEESADNYPDREVEMVIPWSPGGGSDTEGRVVVDHLSEAIEQDMVVVNLPGVGGTVGMEELSEKEANGYHLGQIHEGHLVAHHSGVSDINYDDFEPIASMSSSDQILAVSSEMGVDSLEEFVEYGQSEEIDFGGTVSGIPRVWVEQLGGELDINYNLVGYEGLGEAIQALAGGHIDAAIVDYPSAIEFVEAGHMKFIAVGTEERKDSLPDVPTFVESDYDLTMGINRGYVAPAGTDEEIIDYLGEKLEEVANSDAYIKEVQKIGASVNFMGPEEYSDYLDNQNEVIEDIVSNIDSEEE
ncbi:tripartite tricarboxylate transporter substrate binding protein [Halalkalibacillus sediminis]|uniref:Tripartite tricarboxylate transporter substrate binding protein n=1 Tax=Halalkalibacillus sediminis TaxID=2018042 RepID=A0A2I0QU76_9BACI|nr:tripartite tricarboxylate transporter substrate binding protein [Halalkalibacillus sediminis]PKR77859.1 tripartite tricarboxylate transporter substrate binding protein [Halalkalibacillus sediminis]